MTSSSGLSNPICSVIGTIKQATVGVATVVGIAEPSIPTTALETCPIGSRNCIRTAWSPPLRTSKAQAAAAIREVLKKYPQDGELDPGGWEMVEDDLQNTGTARVEFKSGTGKIAQKLNDGKPFIDDVLFAVQDDAGIVVRSSSRKGYDDMGKNKQRIEKLQGNLPNGWNFPEPKY